MISVNPIGLNNDKYESTVYNFHLRPLMYKGYPSESLFVFCLKKTHLINHRQKSSYQNPWKIQKSALWVWWFRTTSEDNSKCINAESFILRRSAEE